MNLQSANFSIHWMANKLEVSRSGYYAWLHRQDNPGPRAQEEETIAKAINPIFAEHKERYGSFRIHQELRGPIRSGGGTSTKTPVIAMGLWIFRMIVIQPRRGSGGYERATSAFREPSGRYR